MRNRVVLVLALVMLCGVGGCQRESAHEKLVKEGISLQNDFAATLEGVKDEASGKAALSKIESLAKQMEEWQTRMKAATPNVAKDEEEQLKAKYEGERKKAQERLGKALTQALEKGGVSFSMQLMKVMINVK